MLEVASIIVLFIVVMLFLILCKLLPIIVEGAYDDFQKWRRK